MNKLKMLTDKQIADLYLEKGKEYEIDETEGVVVDCYKVKVPMKQKGRFRYALINDKEGELVG